MTIVVEFEVKETDIPVQATLDYIDEKGNYHCTEYFFKQKEVNNERLT